MHKGKIKKLVSDRGFGFIADTDGKEVFFHQSSLVGITFDALKGLIQDNIEEEYVADGEYTGYSEEAEDPEIKSMLIAFRDDEREHVAKLKEILEELEKSHVI